MVSLKKCSGCKQNKEASCFYRNKTKLDGLQTVCKNCSKYNFKKELICSECSSKFYINHRNIKKRKTSICKNCLAEKNTIRIIERNKKTATYKTISKKGYEYLFDFKTGKYKASHRLIIEKYLGRKLTTEEKIHHIDGNRLNNSRNNLYLTTNKEHKIAHKSLELIAFYLVKKGIIVFNRKNGIYELKKEKDEKQRRL